MACQCLDDTNCFGCVKQLANIILHVNKQLNTMAREVPEGEEDNA